MKNKIICVALLFCFSLCLTSTSIVRASEFEYDLLSEEEPIQAEAAVEFESPGFLIISTPKTLTWGVTYLPTGDGEFIYPMYDLKTSFKIGYMGSIPVNKDLKIVPDLTFELTYEGNPGPGIVAHTSLNNEGIVNPALISDTVFNFETFEYTARTLGYTYFAGQLQGAFEINISVVDKPHAD